MKRFQNGHILETNMREVEVIKWWSKEEADAIEREIKQLEYLLKFSRDDERVEIVDDIARLDKRLCEYFSESY